MSDASSNKPGIAGPRPPQPTPPRSMNNSGLPKSSDSGLVGVKKSGSPGAVPLPSASQGGGSNNNSDFAKNQGTGDGGPTMKNTPVQADTGKNQAVSSGEPDSRSTKRSVTPTSIPGVSVPNAQQQRRPAPPAQQKAVENRQQGGGSIQDDLGSQQQGSSESQGQSLQIPPATSETPLSSVMGPVEAVKSTSVVPIDEARVGGDLKPPQPTPPMGQIQAKQVSPEPPAAAKSVGTTAAVTGIGAAVVSNTQKQPPLQTPQPGAPRSASVASSSSASTPTHAAASIPQPAPPVGVANIQSPAPPQPAVPGAVGAVPATELSGKRSVRGGMGKIVMVVVFILLLGMGGFAAYQLWQRISDETPSQEGEIVLTYWGLWEPEEVMQPFIDEFESQHPNVTINYTNSSPIEYAQRLRAALAGDTPPDIFRIHNTWPYTFPDELSRVPESVYTNAEFEQTFYPVAYQNLKIGNELVGIPLMYDGLALYYNEDLFNKAGLQPPTDWTSFVQAAQAIRAPREGAMEIAGAAMGTTTNIDHWPDIVGLLLLQNQADPSNPTNQLAYDAVTFYSLFNYRYQVWDPAWPVASESFAIGKVGMMLGPSWQVFNVNKIAEENDVTLNFKVIPVPQLPETNVTWASYWAEAVAADSDNQEMAWEFLAFLSEKDTMRRLYQEQSKYRDFGEIPSRRDLAPEFADHPYVGPYLSQAEAARSYPLTAGTTDVGGLNDRIIGYYEDAINETSEGAYPEDPMAAVAKGVQEVLRSYGLAQ